MDFAGALSAIADALRRAQIEFALIGGFALAAAGVPRATGDIDLLIPGEHAEAADRIMQALGYRRLHASADVANYASDEIRLGSVDFLFARRQYARRMLQRAEPRRLGGAVVRVVVAEDLIGLKVQASSNNPQRKMLDMSDIESLLQRCPDLDMARVREYFSLFDRENELDAILERLRR